MHNNPYEVLNLLPRKTNGDKGHLDCQKCGYQKCLIFARNVAKGNKKVSDCPFVNNKATSESIVPRASGIAPRKIDVPDSIDESNNKLIAQKREMLARLKKQIPNSTNILSVPADGGLFDLFDHKVTGDELNNVIKIINSQSIEQNKTWINTYNHIADVISLISDLDAEYLKKILVAFHAANLAISELKIANERIDEQQNDIKASQKDITDLVNGMNTTFLVLKKHKEKLDKIQHLEDIDAIFNNQSELSNKFSELNQSIERITTDTSKKYDVLQTAISELRGENAKQARSLLIAKCVSAGNLLLSFVVVILFITMKLN